MADVAVSRRAYKGERIYFFYIYKTFAYPHPPQGTKRERERGYRRLMMPHEEKKSLYIIWEKLEERSFCTGKMRLTISARAHKFTLKRAVLIEQLWNYYCNEPPPPSSVMCAPFFCLAPGVFQRVYTIYICITPDHESEREREKRETHSMRAKKKREKQNVEINFFVMLHTNKQKYSKCWNALVSGCCCCCWWVWINLVWITHIRALAILYSHIVVE